MKRFFQHVSYTVSVAGIHPRIALKQHSKDWLILIRDTDQWLGTSDPDALPSMRTMRTCASSLVAWSLEAGLRGLCPVGFIKYLRYEW